jgi:peptidyl-dipeptidase A
MKLYLSSIIFLSMISFLLLSCSSGPSDEQKLRDFITNHLKVVEPKLKTQNIADWNANATGEKKYYDESAALNLEIKKIRSNKTDFVFLKALKEKGTVKDSLLQRQLILLYNSYLKNQIDTSLMRQIVEKEAAIGEKFNNFRGKLDGKEMSDNDLRKILKDEKNSAKRKLAWEATKQVGREAAPLVIELVKLRNQAAKQLGFENYYTMSLTTDEQNVNDVLAIFDQLKQLTDEPFKKLKDGLDASIAKRFNIKTEKMQAWYYANPFFQEVSEAGEINLDKYFKGKNIVEIATTFYNGIGLPVESILTNSDLYPRKGKYQHAFSNDMDRLGDVRTMDNITDNHEWMGTLLHELGHGTYSLNINRDLPFLLRTESHTFTTEAIAELMGRQSFNVDWLQAMVGIDEKEKASLKTEIEKNLQLSQLAFSRWSQVMVRFERAMYENPDQDLNKLWWDLVEQYQFVKRPAGRNEPDWAAKIHLVQYPCYYHNYTLGELAASQIMNTIVRTVEKQDRFFEISFAGKPEIGDYLKQKIFKPGTSLQWNDLMKHATGEGLTAKYFAEEFVGK